jgi:hypothetical protein
VELYTPRHDHRRDDVRLYLVDRHVDNDDDESLGWRVGEGNGGRRQADKTGPKKDTISRTPVMTAKVKAYSMPGGEEPVQVRTATRTTAAIWPMIHPETRSLMTMRISSTRSLLWEGNRASTPLINGRGLETMYSAITTTPIACKKRPAPRVGYPPNFPGLCITPWMVAVRSKFAVPEADPPRPE